MKYKELQIIKHALQHYVKRPDASEKDIQTELNLLGKITEDVERLKERYGIE